MNIKNSKQHWDNIYTENSPEEVSWFQKKPAISLEIIQSISNTQARIIDVGGGVSSLVDDLLKLGYNNLSVLDISHKAIELSKRKLTNHKDKVEWYVKDITNFVSSHPYDIWHDRAVFHFLTDKNFRELYVNTLKNTVNPDGYVIIATFAKNGPTKCSGLDIVQYDSSSIKKALGDKFSLLNTRLETHLTPKGNEQNFIYFLFRRDKE